MITEQLTNKFIDGKLHEPGHIYRVKGDTYTSVSEKLKQFYKPFDKSIAKWCAIKEGISEEEMLEIWETKAYKARTKGTKVHSFAELYGKWLIGEDAAEHPQERAVIQWYKNMPERYTPIAFEQLLYWEEEKIAGTCDLILYDSITGMLIPADWKTNETDLFRVYNNKKLLYPFNEIEDCQYTKYELQLSYYKAMLKLAGFRVGPCILVWLMPKEDKLYQSFLTRDFSNHLIKYHHDIRDTYRTDTIGIF